MSPALPHVVLLAAPPLGTAAWHDVARRLEHHGLATTIPDLFSPEHARLLSSDGPEALIDALAPLVEGACLVAHGQANPLALHLARRASLRLLVLSNGPVARIDPITRTVSRLARMPGAPVWARPSIVRPLLASSAALRRLVVNPYVMDRDMVARVTESWTADGPRRTAVTRWLRALPALTATAPAPTGPTLLVWGDEDILYPAHVADEAAGLHPDIEHVRVPGGRHLHPIERPWELADAIAARLGSTENHPNHDSNVAISE